MAQARLTDEAAQAAINAYGQLGTEGAAATILKISRSTLQARIRIAKQRGFQPESPITFTEFPNWLKFDIKNGTIAVASDCHYWPNYISTAHKAFVKFCADLQPKAVVLNGDVMDFPSISRHASIGWETRPTVESEIEEANKRLLEIQKAAPNAKRFWSLGNHDARLESRLAAVAPEFAKINGVHLKDHFDPSWRPCWAILVNQDVVIKHRLRGGVHARHANTLHAGKTTVTGHLHALGVTPYSDYNGTRWGVDTGTLADPYGPAFENYTEQGPLNWRSGFVVLTFKDGVLLDPEIVRVVGERKVSFRGEIIKV